MHVAIRSRAGRHRAAAAVEGMCRAGRAHHLARTVRSHHPAWAGRAHVVVIWLGSLSANGGCEHLEALVVRVAVGIGGDEFARGGEAAAADLKPPGKHGWSCEEDEVPESHE